MTYCCHSYNANNIKAIVS